MFVVSTPCIDLIPRAPSNASLSQGDVDEERARGPRVLRCLRGKCKFLHFLTLRARTLLHEGGTLHDSDESSRFLKRAVENRQQFCPRRYLKRFHGYISDREYLR